MDDDFARYVISDKWTALRIEDPPWFSPDARIKILEREFSEEESLAWISFQKAHETLQQLNWNKLVIKASEQPDKVVAVEEGHTHKEETSVDPELSRAEHSFSAASSALQSVLTPEHFRLLQELLAAKSDPNLRYPPRLDIRQIKRYILWRVFDLGWTIERFGEFDRFSIGYEGRDASKAERIGKKYQWIAYHEIMALVADHFQYGEQFGGEESDRAYDGPWQDHFRDIDPSSTLRGSQGMSPWAAHVEAWWGPIVYKIS